MIRYLNDINELNYTPCPICGAIGKFKYHGKYQRHVIDLFGERIISIKRVRCLSCKHTHSLIPSGVIPYKLYAETFPSMLIFAFAISIPLTRIAIRFNAPLQTLKRYIKCAKMDASLIFACNTRHKTFLRKIKGHCISSLSYLSRNILGRKFTENIRLNNLAPT